MRTSPAAWTRVWHLANHQHFLRRSLLLVPSCPHLKNPRFSRKICSSVSRTHYRVNKVRPISSTSTRIECAKQRRSANDPVLNSKLIGRPVFPFPVLIRLAATLILECERESDAPRSTSEQVFRNSADWKRSKEKENAIR